MTQITVPPARPMAKFSATMTPSRQVATPVGQPQADSMPTAQPVQFGKKFGLVKKSVAALALAGLPVLGMASPASANPWEDFQQLKEQVSSLTQRMDQAEHNQTERDNGQDNKINGLDGRLGNLEKTVDELSKKVNNNNDKDLNGKVQRLSNDVNNLNTRLNGMSSSLGSLQTTVKGLQTQVSSMDNAASKGSVSALGKRLDTLEATVNKASQAGGVATQKDVQDIRKAQGEISRILTSLQEQGKISQEEADSIENPLSAQIDALSKSDLAMQEAIQQLQKQLDNMSVATIPNQSKDSESTETPEAGNSTTTSTPTGVAETEGLDTTGLYPQESTDFISNVSDTVSELSMTDIMGWLGGLTGPPALLLALLGRRKDKKGDGSTIPTGPISSGPPPNPLTSTKKARPTPAIPSAPAKSPTDEELMPDLTGAGTPAAPASPEPAAAMPPAPVKKADPRKTVAKRTPTPEAPKSETKKADAANTNLDEGDDLPIPPFLGR